MNIIKPNIFDYNNYRKFLAEYQDARVAEDKSFTKSNFSRLLGLPNTRSFVTDVIAGKNITSAFIERFTSVLGLTRDEAQFFRVLVLFNQAQSSEERELYFDQLISLNRTPKRVLDESVYSYYKNWYNSVIRALLHIYDFHGDYSELAKKVFPAITPTQAKASIKLLDKLGLIIKNSSGVFKPTDKSIATPDGVRDELIKNYQLSCLDMAKNSLIKNSDMSQSISTNVLSISDEGYKRIEKKIKKFRSEIRSIVHKDEKPADRVYQMNISLFPNSR
jgi:uncharacterized protein (TIGR02147 family)